MLHRKNSSSHPQQRACVLAGAGHTIQAGRPDGYKPIRRSNNQHTPKPFAFAVGKLWKTLQCYQEAGHSFELALKKAMSLYGQEPVLIGSTLLSLGDFLQQTNRTRQALVCFDEASKVRTALYGPESPSVAEVEYSKGVALLFHGDFYGATDCLHRSLRIRQERLGPTDSAVGDTLNSIGFLQLRSGKISDQRALGPLTKALEIRRAVGNTSKVVSTLQNIGSVHKKLKQFDKCVDVYAEIVSLRQGEFGKDYAVVAGAWIRLGNIQTSAGRLVEANVSYEEALRLRMRHSGDRPVAQLLFKMGSLRARQKDYARAKKLLKGYMRLRAGEDSNPDEEMAQALTLMGDLHKETGKRWEAHISWALAAKMYQRLGYPKTHAKLWKVRARQNPLLFGPLALSKLF